MLGITIIYETMIYPPHFNGFNREQRGEVEPSCSVVFKASELHRIIYVVVISCLSDLDENGMVTKLNPYPQ